MKTKLLALLLGLITLISVPSLAFARNPNEISDWYIKDFRSEIELQTDSSLHITEYITADCGDLPDKHGIFRSLPTQFMHNGQEVKTPVKLISITDFNGNSYPYTTEKSFAKPVVTWKIGDADKVVHGENQYRLEYEIKNAVIVNSSENDFFHWNVLGNFWDLEIDNFNAIIRLPATLDATNTSVDYQTGSLGSHSQDYAAYSWQNDHTILIQSSMALPAETGITMNLTMPDGTFTAYNPTFLEKFGDFLWLLLPLFTLIIMWQTWRKNGQDPKLNRTIIAQYEPPADLTPLETNSIISNGSVGHHSISAEIISLAVNKIIKIEEIPKKSVFSQKDYRLSLTADKETIDKLPAVDQLLVKGLFSSKMHNTGILEQPSISSITEAPLTDKVDLSDLKNKFLPVANALKEMTKKKVINEKYFSSNGFSLQTIFLIIGVLIASSSFITIELATSLANFISILASGIIIIVFGIFMPKLTPKGAETVWHIKGFRLFMETAEKYRQQFNEKENIFEKFLPYAIAFSMTDLWVKKMKTIYGENYFASYHPYWFAGSYTSFDANSFTSSLNSVTSAIASNASSSSSGGSGGGGGGGGGGGW